MIWLDKSNILFGIYQEMEGENTEKLPNIFVKSISEHKVWKNANTLG